MLAVSDRVWSVNFPFLTEKEAGEVASFLTDGVGLPFAYAYDPRQWFKFEMDEEGVRCIVAALKSAQLDECSATFLEDCEVWLAAQDAQEP